MYLKWFLLLIEIYRMVSKLVSKLAIRILATDILDSKLVLVSLLETNLKSKILVAKTLVANG